MLTDSRFLVMADEHELKAPSGIVHIAFNYNLALGLNNASLLNAKSKDELFKYTGCVC